jgi:cardiolipin synthase
MLLVQPEDGSLRVVEALGRARRTIDLCVFRLDHPAIETALADAVARSVVVRVLLSHANGSGKAALKRLDQRLARLGCRVRRSRTDLARYHGKLMLIDGARLYVLGFNLTRRDVDRSRSLGLTTTRPRVVAAAAALFEADFRHRAHVPEPGALVVSPYNSRSVLARLLQDARRQLLIYDLRLADRMMIGLIEQKAREGVEVRVIGKMERASPHVQVVAPPRQRLHVRAIVQDGLRLFVGSQSLRRAELDKRREIGLLVSDRADVARAVQVFEADWAAGTGAQGLR